MRKLTVEKLPVHGKLGFQNMGNHIHNYVVVRLVNMDKLKYKKYHFFTNYVLLRFKFSINRKYLPVVNCATAIKSPNATIIFVVTIYFFFHN